MTLLCQDLTLLGLTNDKAVRHSMWIGSHRARREEGTLGALWGDSGVAN